MNDNIKIYKAEENNLKGFDIEIPKNQLVVFAGVSGSGKSSLVFDTIANECAREWQSSYPLFIRNKMPHYDRPKVDRIENLTPAIIIDQNSFGASSRSSVGTAIDVAPLIRLLFSRCGVPSAGGSMAYSFNHPAGMCQECTGLGEEYVLKEDTMFDLNKSLSEGAILFSQFSSGWQTHLYQNNLLLDPNKKLKDFSIEEWNILKNGSKEKIQVGIKSNNTGRVDMVDYEGVIPRFYRLYLKRDISKLKQSVQDEIMSHVDKCKCHVCNGTGLNPKALESKINGFNIVDYMDMTVIELLPIINKIDNPVGKSIANQIKSYLERMIDVGIGYLSLSRKTDTLSGGELQRIKMVRNLGSSLSNITYIFDEPTQGLHPYDAKKIGDMLISLRDKRNNVLVVEHNKEMIELADHIIEMGPSAGVLGGNVIFEGSLKELKNKDTKTAKSLNEKIEINHHPRSFNETFGLKDLHSHNLKHIDVNIPKGILTALCGVAGSGKSSIMKEFVKNYKEAIWIDQKPIGTSIRSTPATYVGIMDEIRKIYGKVNNVDPSYLSFNSKGACPICGGTGRITFDMAFADSVTVVCEECGGHRYNKQALFYKYKGLNIEEVMNLTIDEAYDFFENDKIRKLLKGLLEVGLGYMTLGQPTSTLSGGEIQRIKLASYLHKKGNIYVLDEPSTGLHHDDAIKLLLLLKGLVSDGNTVIIIEHRLDLIASADYIIEVGPNGGSEGGRIVFEGTPKQLLSANTKTAEYLKRLIK